MVISLQKFGILKIFLFFKGEGERFLADATPSPLTTPNPLKKPFKVAVLRTDLTNFIKNSFEFLIKFQIC